MMPASMLAPSAWVATSPSSARAAAVMRVVVDFPFVPVISAVRFPAARRPMMFGSIFSATRPPIIDPLPRPAVRDAQRAADAAPRASDVRRGTRVVEPPGAGTRSGMGRVFHSAPRRAVGAQRPRWSGRSSLVEPPPRWSSRPHWSSRIPLVELVETTPSCG
ncbi:Uncharacterised protein [Mycobacteroides abscessus subsp. abscessus]|nr:Uncharacterised protein [Mycobacteroides abscessus subsp. abscessus]